MHSRQLIALLMVCAYLFLPLESFANLEPPFSYSSPGGISLLEITSPGDPASHCPCTDRHAPDGCNPSCSCCSCCSFSAPLPAGVAWRASQLPVSFSSLDPFKHLPEVYLPIFVPPQNRS
jgi:hypothetical protein